MRVVFVHGACVRDGAWWWHRTAELLTEAGVPSVAPLLPSCGEVGAAGRHRRSGAARGRRGGPPGPAGRRRADGGGRPQLRRDRHRRGYFRDQLCAPPGAGVQLPSRGRPEPCPTSATAHPPRSSTSTRTAAPSASGLELLVETFLQDCDSDFQAQAADRLARQSVAGHGAARGSGGLARGPLDLPRLRPGPGHAAASPARLARRAGHVVELDTGHLRSCPDQLQFGTCCSACDHTGTRRRRRLIGSRRSAHARAPVRPARHHRLRP